MTMHDQDDNGKSGGVPEHEDEISAPHDTLFEESEECSPDETFWASEDCPPEVLAQFWQNVAEYELAPLTTHFRRLEEAGIKPPSPESVDDKDLPAVLWEVIDGLAEMRVFLEDTNHLSDRELYALLWNEVLRESVKDMSFGEGSAWHLQLLGTGSEEDNYLYMKYYADEDYRKHWLASFPEDELPEHQDPPYDRDRFLPPALRDSVIDAADSKPM
jgi:hypothetical protein